MREGGNLDTEVFRKPTHTAHAVPQRLSPSLHTLDIIQTFNYETPLTVDSEAKKNENRSTYSES